MLELITIIVELGSLSYVTSMLLRTWRPTEPDLREYLKVKHVMSLGESESFRAKEATIKLVQLVERESMEFEWRLKPSIV